MRSYPIIVTCEHAGNHIPDDYKHLFAEEENVLGTHKGWDIGALSIAQAISKELDAELYYTEISRLLVECNRSINTPDLFSKFTESLDFEEKKKIMDLYYYPYRNKVEEAIAKAVKNTTVVHLSIHSFTPIWNGNERKVDIGLLFDDDRDDEFKFCENWKTSLENTFGNMSIKYNEPYHGKEDGFTTHLRQKYSENQYLGIELEVNQKWVYNSVSKRIASTLKGLIPFAPSFG
ncbi:MAG: N-formylglutamate amidohydrolase [Cyclobacteriaceae bacterium]|nr:N-formylglutamate amidohydrolase [Cyclobacteriaceae bacterium]